MRGSRLLLAACALLAGVALCAGPGAAATKKRKRALTPTATPTATAPSATPTPGPELKKAAGTCLRYEAGAYIMLSEVGRPGRAFLIDSGTDVVARPRRGARLRILYIDAPEGPVARKIMPGPAEEKP
jgi:hypothetical protein